VSGAQDLTGPPKTHDNALAEREQLLRAFDQAPGFVAMLESPEHRFTFANAAYRALVGGRNVVGKTAREALPELQGQGFFELLDQVYRSGEPFRGTSMPARVVRAPGQPAEERIFDFVYQPVTDPDGRVTGIFAQGVDVTERHTAEHRVTEVQRRLDAVLNNASVAIFLMDERQHCAYMNRAAEELTGYSFAETQDRPLHDVIHHTHPDGRPFPLEDCAIDRAFPENADTRGEEVFVHKDGSFYPVAFVASPIRDEASRTIGTIIEVRNISREKAAQQALKKAQAKAEAEAAEHSAILGQLAEGVIVTDPAGRITFVNEAARRIHGVAELNVEPGQYAEVYHLLTEAGEPHPPEELPLARAVLRGETVSDARWRIRRPDGSDVLAVGSAKPVVDVTGGQVGALLTLRDETARAAAEHALRESEARLRALTDNLPSGMVYQISTGADGSERRFLFVSQSIEKLTGIPAAAVLADPTIPYHLILPEDRPALVEAERIALRDRSPFDVQVRFRRADGEVRWSRIISAPREQPDGSLIWDGIQIDITEEKATGQALQAESEALETLNRTGAAVAAELDLEKVVQQVTDAGVELTGAQFGSYFHNEMDETGERLHLFTLSGADRDAFIRMGRPRATGVFGPTFRNEGVIRSGDILADPRYGQFEPHRGMPKGHLPVRSYLAVSVVSRSGEVLGGLLFGHPEPHRFTERHERLIVGLAAQAAIAIDNARLFQAVQQANETLEARVAERTEELVRTQEALQQSQKMEAVGQLTGGIAHDFNNLLAGIVGSLDLMQTRITQGRTGDLARYVGAAMSSAQRAAALTHRLLAFSRRQPLDPKPVEANRLVAGMEDLLRRTLGPSISLEMVMAGGLWRTLCDPVQLESALLNLCINARDAMPDGGKLTIETANAHLDDAYAAAQRDVTPGQYVAICVTDTGVGMSAELISRVFEPFFTTKPLGQGTGLGLSMVYGFAKQSEGHVRIYSEEGQGTTVKLYLPRYRGADREEDTQDQLVEAPRAEAGETVLVVEDEPVVRDLIVEVLGDLGYKALEAGDGPSGLKLLQSKRRIDLLITDVGLPGLNGRQLADHAREKRPGLKVLFITGYAENATMANGFLEPGMAMVTKPFAVDGLMRKIRQLIEDKADG
jgi:PAS domain S-box-containing protein